MNVTAARNPDLIRIWDFDYLWFVLRNYKLLLNLILTFHAHTHRFAISPALSEIAPYRSVSYYFNRSTTKLLLRQSQNSDFYW